MNEQLVIGMRSLSVKKRKTARRRRLTDPGARFLAQMGRYMKTRGWNVVVAGPIGIVRGLDHRHQLVINFLGAERKPAERKTR